MHSQRDVAGSRVGWHGITEARVGEGAREAQAWLLPINILMTRTAFREPVSVTGRSEEPRVGASAM